MRRTETPPPGVTGVTATLIYGRSLCHHAMTLPIPLISSHPDRLGGEPCFAGTRVPVRALIDYVEGGHPLAEFLADFPAVSREHAIAVLELARQALLSQAVTHAA